MMFRVLIFYFFLFRTNSKKEHLDVNNFRHGYGIIFQKCYSESYLILALFKVLSQKLQYTLTTAFERHYAVEDFKDMEHTCSFFLG